MLTYPIPPNITRDQFHGLITDLYYKLTARGIDPAPNLMIEDFDECLEDGTIRTHFSILVSEDAAAVLAKS